MSDRMERKGRKRKSGKLRQEKWKAGKGKKWKTKEKTKAGKMESWEKEKVES